MPTRPSLGSLPLSKKAPQQVAEPEIEEAEPPPSVADPVPKPAKPKRDEKVVLMVRVSRADRKKMRQIAIADDTTVQDLVEEAVKDILRRRRIREP